MADIDNALKVASGLFIADIIAFAENFEKERNMFEIMAMSNPKRSSSKRSSTGYAEVYEKPNPLLFLLFPTAAASGRSFRSFAAAALSSKKSSSRDTPRGECSSIYL